MAKPNRSANLPPPPLPSKEKDDKATPIKIIPIAISIIALVVTMAVFYLNIQWDKEKVSLQSEPLLEFSLSPDKQSICIKSTSANSKISRISVSYPNQIQVLIPEVLGLNNDCWSQARIQQFMNRTFSIVGRKDVGALTTFPEFPVLLEVTYSKQGWQRSYSKRVVVGVDLELLFEGAKRVKATPVSAKVLYAVEVDSDRNKVLHEMSEYVKTTGLEIGKIAVDMANLASQPEAGVVYKFANGKKYKATLSSPEDVKRQMRPNPSLKGTTAGKPASAP